MEHFSFLKVAIRDKNVGAVAPTTGASVRHTCRQVDYRRPVVLVEYGPGTGAFTRYLLKRLYPGSVLLAIELNRAFASKLRRYDRRRKRKHSRLIVARSDARNVRALLRRHGFEHADYVICGIPFSFIDEAGKREIMQQTFEALAPEGWLIVYQYTFRVSSYLYECFGNVNTRRSFLNVPPLCVMEAEKRICREALAVGSQLVEQELESPLLVDAAKR